jgi:HEPN domain-containing protein
MDKYLKNWLIKGNNDLKTAEIGLNQPKDDIVTDTICFHCQQAAEKFLKSYLIFKGKTFGKTHDLEYILELCKEEDTDFSNLPIGSLTDYAVSLRYPDDFYLPSEKEALAAFSISKNVKEFVFKKLGIQEIVF